MPTIEDVARTWVDTAELSPLEDGVLYEIVWKLLAGTPISPSDLCDSLGLPLARIEDALASLETKRCLRRAGGAVVAARGLMVQPSPHQLLTQWGCVYTQCAVDAIGIPTALGVEATVQDHCAVCRQAITVDISRSGTVTAQPRTTAVAMARSDGRMAEGIPQMCRETNLFCESKHAAGWLREQATLPGAIGDTQAAAALGPILWYRFARHTNTVAE